MICIDPWEHHCVECGEPYCYRTCPKYRPARTGRCERFEGGRFLAWGKIELLWHGRMADAWAQVAMRLFNGVLEPLALGLGPRVYRVFRSVRWRLGRLIARRTAQPTLWRIACSSEEATQLFASIALPDGKEIVRRRLSLKPGVECRVELSVPRLPELSLFRIASYDGTPAPVVFRVNELIASPDASAGRTPPIKCVAWDLDDTLWEGTLSEGDDVRVRPACAAAVRALDARGVVNSLCSKNDPDAALGKLKELGLEEFFVFPQIGWDAKSVNLKRLAKEMNLALDALAFVDDREENRAEVRANAPGVKVFAETEIDRLLEACPEPEGAEGTLGSARRRMYREEMARHRASSAFGADETAFEEQSHLDVELLPVMGERVVRCRELVQRTNQLTLTARRYSEDAFARLLASSETRAVHVWDKYGDYGLVGFVAWDDTHLLELVFSCRVAHRGVERKVLERLPKGLEIEVVETERNGPIREILASWRKERV